MGNHVENPKTKPSYLVLSNPRQGKPDAIWRSVFPNRKHHPTTWRRRLIRPDSVCAECGGTKHLEVDHVIPLGLGGSDSWDNVQLLCAVCHRQKNDTWAVRIARGKGARFIDKVCERCGIAFVIDFGHRRRRFCSRDCYAGRS